MSTTAPILALVVLAASGADAPVSAAPDEERLKAAFLVRFTTFVDWPESEPGAFELCISGDGDVLDAVREMIHGKQVRGRSVTVRGVSHPSQATSCELVFVGRSTSGGPDAWLGQHGVLTVGDAPDFARRGGVIGLVHRGPNLRFEVHRGAARRSGLRLDARLLNLAEAVHE